MQYTNEIEIPKMLKRQVTEPVQWQRCMKYAKDGFVFDWVVLGPSKVLANIVKKEYPHDKVT